MQVGVEGGVKDGGVQVIGLHHSVAEAGKWVLVVLSKTRLSRPWGTVRHAWLPCPPLKNGEGV